MKKIFPGKITFSNDDINLTAAGKTAIILPRFLNIREQSSKTRSI